GNANIKEKRIRPNPNTDVGERTNGVMEYSLYSMNYSEFRNSAGWETYPSKKAALMKELGWAREEKISDPPSGSRRSCRRHSWRLRYF
ncbi:MAG: hypothetical protein FWF31_07040, partial [Desulfobulbus sp.]|nr:hypothetical protein [Desulfobulbus sp.]